MAPVRLGRPKKKPSELRKAFQIEKLFLDFYLGIIASPSRNKLLFELLVKVLLLKKDIVGGAGLSGSKLDAIILIRKQYLLFVTIFFSPISRIRT